MTTPADPAGYLRLSAPDRPLPDLWPLTADQYADPTEMVSRCRAFLAFPTDPGDDQQLGYDVTILTAPLPHVVLTRCTVHTLDELPPV